MSWFFNEIALATATPTSRKKHRSGLTAAAYNDGGCSTCPRKRTWTQLSCPHMEPQGNSKPVVYFLGEATSEAEDDQGVYLPRIGSSAGQLLDGALSDWDSIPTRWNHVVRCYGRKSAELPEIESCRRSVEEDIAASRPKVVVGFGNVPLHWVSGLSQITLYRGRVFPVNIGGHECWYYVVNHPSYVVHQDKRNDINPHRVIFKLDIEYLFTKLLPTLPAAHVWDYVEGAKFELFDGSSSSQVSACIRAIEQLDPFGTSTDIETTALSPYSGREKILCASVSSADVSVSFVLDHPQSKWTKREKLRVWQAYYDHLMYGPVRVAHNAKFEQKWLSHECGTSVIDANWHDTMASAHTLDGRPGALGLDDVVFLRFGFRLKAATGVDPTKWQSTPLPKFLLYNALDSLWCYRAHLVNMELLAQDPSLLPEYARACRVGTTLVLTEDVGVAPNLPVVPMIELDLQTQIADLTSDIMKTPEVRKHVKAVGKFSPTSPADVGEMFGVTFKRPEVLGRDGSISSGEEQLSALPSDLFPSAPKILQLRSVAKLLSTYVAPIASGALIQADGRIHTNYNHLLVVTGRLSSDNPNLQNYPKRKYKFIRALIKAVQRTRYGKELLHYLVSADYGQIEARVIAMASEDRALVEHLWTGFDIHGHWADYLIDAFPKIQDRMAADYEISRDDIKGLRKAVRNEIKNGWVFPQFYGSVPESCAGNLKIPVEIAKRMGHEFWGEFTGVKKWQNRTISKWERTGYVETLTGRRRHGPMSVNEIINTCSQGTASDLVVDAMSVLSEMWRWDMSGGMDDRFQAAMNIHDDLTFGLPEDSLEEDIGVIAEVMCSSADRFNFVNVPITVEVSCGTDWSNQEEIGVFSSEDYRSGRR